MRSFFLCFLLLVNYISLADELLENLEKRGFKVIARTSLSFNRSFELTLRQPLIHGEITILDSFDQRLFLGFRGSDKKVLAVFEGYAASFSSGADYRHQLDTIVNGNQLVIEHRYYGRSIPNRNDFKGLTIEEAAKDADRINKLLEGLIDDQWICTGTSKGGHGCLGFMVQAPQKVKSAVLFSTPVRKDKNDPRLKAWFSGEFSKAEGKQVESYFRFLLKKQPELVNIRKQYSRSISFLSDEDLVRYQVFEFPFSFFQNCQRPELLPDTSDQMIKHWAYLNSIVPETIFEEKKRTVMQTSFYMFNHELGYYEYDVYGELKTKIPVNRALGPDVKSDDSYFKIVNRLIEQQNIPLLFIYGNDDPYSAFLPSSKNIIVVNGRCHRVTINNLDGSAKEKLIRLIK